MSKQSSKSAKKTRTSSSSVQKSSSRQSRQSNTSVRSEQESVEVDPASMTNEMRMRYYAKKLFAGREHCGWLVFRNPTKAAQSSNVPLQQSPLVNPIASTIGSKIFGKPDFDNLESDSSLRLDANGSINQTTNSSNSSKPEGGSKTEGFKSNAAKK